MHASFCIFNFAFCIAREEANIALGWIKITTLATVLVWMSAADAWGETARYNVDPDHSTIGFSVDDMRI